MISTSNAFEDEDKPTIIHSNLGVETVYKGLDFPTTMTFIGPDDILVLEKEKGTVQRISEGKLHDDPLLDVEVSYMQERGMLGIAVLDNRTINPNPYVFLYYSKSHTDDDDNIANSTYSVSNYLYRYELVGDSKLSNPKLLLSTPASTAPYHVGGKITIGPDNNVFVTIGDQTKFDITQAQNIEKGAPPDKTGGILRVTKNGEPVGEGILGNTYPLSLYYAYGIRNSFGIDFDPVTGKLWDTENGPFYGDEINLVEPGFNSGWSQVQGIWEPTINLTIGDTILHPGNLVNFDGKGRYSSPEFVWREPDCPSAIKFLDTNEYGDDYENDLLVGTSSGDLYHFDLNESRTSLVLEGSLKDKIAETESDEEINQIKLGHGFGGITDMQVGPYDGLLYIVSRDGAIHRIFPQGSDDKYESKDKGVEKWEDDTPD